MKQFGNKTLLSAAITAALTLASASANASFAPFTVNEGSVVGTPANSFVAGKLTGNYVEDVTLNSNGTFTSKILFNAGTFGDINGSTIPVSYLTSAVTPAAGTNAYALYGIVMGSGTFAASSTGTVFTFTPGGSLTLTIDPTNDTSFGTTTGVTGGAGDDYDIGSGTVTGGGGTLSNTCTSTTSINCGSFGTNTSLALTPLGTNFFTAPIPFYNLSLASGQFDFIDVTKTGLQRTTGSLDATFVSSATTVPEPESIALFGIGLLSLGAGLRRRKQAL